MLRSRETHFNLGKEHDYRAVARFLCLGGGQCLTQRSFPSRVAAKKMFLPSWGVRGHAPLEKF